MIPEPRGVRTPPPIIPPAPPGNAGGPESGGGGGDGDAQRLYDTTVEGLNDLAVMRTTLETRAVFPDDAELQAELIGIADGARLALQIRLQVAEREFVKGESEWAVETRRRLALVHADLDTLGQHPERSPMQAFESYGSLLMWLIMHGADPRRDTESH